jgi:hypothetical protein
VEQAILPVQFRTARQEPSTGPLITRQSSLITALRIITHASALF